jgi:DNA repair ATPase RecN
LARAAADAKKAAEANAEMEALNAAQEEFDRLYVQYGEAWEALNARKDQLRHFEE